MTTDLSSYCAYQFFRDRKCANSLGMASPTGFETLWTTPIRTGVEAVQETLDGLQ